jgi:hypothetical protein
VLGNWTGGQQIRIHFGPQLELAEHLAKKDRIRTYKEIAEYVMSKIAELADSDRKMYEEKQSAISNRQSASRHQR